MDLKKIVGKWILKRKVGKMLEKLMSGLQGKKTYVTATLGIVIAVVGHFLGPLSVGGVEIPQISSGQMWEAVWMGLMALFMRKGVSASGPAQ